MNAINVIVPYRWEGMWVFDDARAGLDMEGWLCPALFKYFESAPPQIHVQVRPREIS